MKKALSTRLRVLISVSVSLSDDVLAFGGCCR